MGEFNVNKSDGSLEQTAGMPSEYPATQVMMSDGVTSVEDALDGLTEDSGWLQIGATGIYYRKIGKQVTIKGTFNNSGSTTLATLPSGYRPVDKINRCLYYSASETCELTILTTGEIRVSGTINGCNMQESFLLD